MKSYRTKCNQCDKVLLDPRDVPIYVVPEDRYYCNQRCLTLKGKKELEKDE